MQLSRQSTNNRNLRKLIMLAILLWLLLSSLLGFIVFYKTSSDLEQEAKQSLNDLSSRLNIELDKYRTIPKLLSSYPAITEALNEGSVSTLEKTNRLLKQYNNDLLSDALYLIDTNGVTIASSNAYSSESFVGFVYKFRPYFQQSIQGNSGNYFALGTVSGKRGYYFSHPVIDNQKIIGVLVIKVDLTAIENNWLENDFEFLLTDIHGVVFFSSHTPWNYNSLTHLPLPIETNIVQQRQYGTKTPSVLTQKKDIQSIIDSTKITLSINHVDTDFYQLNTSMQDQGWRIFALVKVSPLYIRTFTAFIAFSLIYLLLCLIAFSWRRTIETRQELALINERLELIVNERTVELSTTNNQLLKTIDKQTETEARLKQTQSELIQAGKLAVLGEMAASINHELNQPLTAIQIFTENLQRFAKRGDLDSVKDNAEEILKLHTMMAKIVAQYKFFSRKSAGKLGPVSVQESVSGAIAILGNKLNNHRIEFLTDAIDDNLQVLADTVPLEQVLINLLNNALQAVATTIKPKISLTVAALADSVHIKLSDNGPGFTEEELRRLFEPFYTTKGLGLGLGLTISQRIVTSFNGKLIAQNNSHGGALFTVHLPRHTNQRV